MAGKREISADKFEELEQQVRLAELKARQAEAELRFLEAQAKARGLRVDKNKLAKEKKLRRKASRASGAEAS